MSMKDQVIRRVHSSQQFVASFTFKPFLSVGVGHKGYRAPQSETREMAPAIAGSHDFPSLAVTTASGVFLAANGKVCRWLDGSYYGLTWDEKEVFLIRRGNTRTRSFPFRTLFPSRDLLLGYSLDKLNGPLRSRVVASLSKRIDVHSIDLFDGLIYCPLTSQNAILVCDPATNWKKVTRLGPRAYKRGAAYVDEYLHLNSVFINEEQVLLMAHNDTSYTGRNSQIVKVSRSSLLQGSGRGDPSVVVNSAGSHGHNIVAVGRDLYWCDSLNYAVRKNGKTIFADREAYLSRGLDLDGQWMAVGGSKFEPDRKLRGRQDGKITLLRYSDSGEVSVRSEVIIPGSGHVCDVRFLKNSLSLSRQKQTAPEWLRQLS
jgi:hypothetical protein